MESIQQKFSINNTDIPAQQGRLNNLGGFLVCNILYLYLREKKRIVLKR